MATVAEVETMTTFERALLEEIKRHRWAVEALTKAVEKVVEFDQK
jgi:hypothetical protein